MDEFGREGIVHFGAQPPHHHIHRIRVCAEINVPDVLRNFRPGHDLANGTRQLSQEQEFFSREIKCDARTNRPVSELLDEWDRTAPQFESMLAAAPAEIAGQAIFDAATHEHDLRNALGVPGARESDAIDSGWEWIVGARTRAGAQSLCFVIEGGEESSGVGDPVARIEASRFELFRAVSGRRTADEVARYAWDREPDPALLLGADIFTIRTASLGE